MENFILPKIIFLFVNLFSFFTLALLLISLYPGAFAEYKVEVHFLQLNQTLTEILFENITNIYDNGTFSYNLTVYALNYSEIVGTGIVYDNLTCPSSFFYLPNVGNSTINRKVPLTLISENNGTYIYMGKQYIDYVEIKYFYYVNSSGVPYKIVILQIGENGKPVSNITYTLIASNIINHEVVPILPKGFNFAKGIKVSLSSSINDSLNETIGSYILPFTIIFAVVLLGVRKIVKKV